MIATLLLLAGVSVELPMEARVRGTEVTVGEIATVTGDDPAEVARVAAVRLGGSPMPGYSRLFQSGRLEARIEREAGLDVRLVGHAACRVRPEVETIAEERLAAVAGAELRRLAEVHDVEFAMRPQGRPLEIPLGDAPAELRSRLDERSLVSGTVSVPVEIVIDGAPWRTVWTTWDVALYESRTVLRRDVRAGERLGPDLFERRRVEVARPGAANPLGRQMVLGAVAARDLRADQMVTQLDVNRPVAIRRGDTLYLQARKGAVVARVPAVARENGAIGDRILVETLANGRQMSGLVLSQDLVEIDLGAR